MNIGWWRQRSRNGEVEEETAFHIEQLAEQLRASGMSGPDALDAARRRFGNVTKVREDVRRVHSSEFLESIGQDIHYALRTLGRNPGFAFTAVLVAALGIGPTTAVFGVVDRILFRPLPYAHEDRLVSVGMTAPLDSNEFMFVPDYNELKRNSGPFEAVTAFQAGAFDCDLTEQNPLRLHCLRVEANFLPMLGSVPAAGRTFSKEEDLPNGPRVAIISYGLWQSRFSGDPAAIGRTLPIDGTAVTIAGVAARSFEVPTLTQADILLPLAISPAERGAGRALRVFARMKDGLTPQQCRRQLEPQFQRALEGVPPQFRKEVGFKVQPLRDRQVGDARLVSLALLGAVVSVLLIACGNIATLLIARGVAREREMAMRAAFGASRGRLIRQGLTESLVIGLAGGAAGAGLAWGLLRAFVALAPGGLPRLEQASIDWRVLGFALVASIAAGVAFGLAPALRRPSSGVIGGWRSVSPRGDRLKPALVILEIAMSIILLAGSGLLLRTLWSLARVSLGMEADHVLTANFALGRQRYSDSSQQVAFFTELEQHLQAIPGVEAAGITDSLPPSGGTRARPLSTLGVEGQAERPEGTGGMVAWRYVTPGYFAALRIPIAAGRGFLPADRDPKAYSIVLSQTLARSLFPGQDPLGHRLLKGPNGEWFTVIGVAADVKNSGLAKPAGPEYYLVRKAVPDLVYANQEPPMGWRGASAVLRTSIDPRLTAATIRDVFAQLDPTLPVQIQSMNERLTGISAGARFNAALLTFFAACGLLLAVVGLYGVVAFLVGQRTQEIGVRMALGATPGGIAAMIAGIALRWTAAGVAIGLVGAFFTMRFLRTMLFGVAERDPWTFAAAVPVLLAASLLAAWLPSRRAARLDPATALRHD